MGELILDDQDKQRRVTGSSGFTRVREDVMERNKLGFEGAFLLSLKLDGARRQGARN